jgi:hypothetical protein
VHTCAYAVVPSQLEDPRGPQQQQNHNNDHDRADSDIHGFLPLTLPPYSAGEPSAHLTMECNSRTSPLPLARRVRPWG